MKNLCCVKGEGAVNHNTVTGWLKKFCSGYKNLNDQARSGRPKTVDSETTLRGKSSKKDAKVSGKFGTS